MYVQNVLLHKEMEEWEIMVAKRNKEAKELRKVLKAAERTLPEDDEQMVNSRCTTLSLTSPMESLLVRLKGSNRKQFLVEGSWPSCSACMNVGTFS